MGGHIKCHMFRITKGYFQGITRVKKPDQHSVLSLSFFINTAYSSSLIFMSIHSVFKKVLGWPIRKDSQPVRPTKPLLADHCIIQFHSK